MTANYLVFFWLLLSPSIPFRESWSGLSTNTPYHIVGTATLISGCPAITAKHVLEELRENANFKPETYD